MASDKLQLSDNGEFVRTYNSPELWPLKDDMMGTMPPPPAVQKVAAMSTLHSDAPVFVPGQPFQLRSYNEDLPLFATPPPGKIVTIFCVFNNDEGHFFIKGKYGQSKYT